MKAIIAYVPVIHKGYLSFFERHLPADIFLLGATSIKLLFNEEIGEKLSRDVRAVSPPLIRRMLKSNYSGVFVEMLMTTDQLKGYSEIVMPDEDISRIIEEKITWATASYDHTFLRWDWSQSTAKSEVVGKFAISTDPNDKEVMAMARACAGNSSDFWRHVGAAIKIPRRKKLLLGAYNEHMPDAHAPYINGDPRIDCNPGKNLEICTAIHAEASLIARAAKEGIALNGLSIYVTTFPCAGCARSIAKAGIKKVFFESGYSVLDAAEILEKSNIEIIQVK
ncbi:MAG TPA: deaminase [Candidatus Paceibacterota bacterium]|jgi:dCMP deaminase|nr:deaminase [Candidatus Paceibacterota bacterium]